MKKGEVYLVNEVHQELEREDLLQTIKYELKQNHQIMAIFYTGFIEQSYDSNLHLHMVVQPVFYEETLQHKRVIASTFGKVLFFEEDMKQQETIIVHYENLLKVFITFHDPKMLKPSIDYKKITIIDDPYGIISYIYEQSKALSYILSFEDLDNWRTKFFSSYYEFYGIISYIYEQSKALSYILSFEDLDNWRTKFFSSYYEFYRSLQVNESYKARHCLDVMRWLVATMWMIEDGNKPNDYLDWSHMEGNDSVLNTSQKQKLKQWGLSTSPKELQEVIKSIVEEFYQLHEMRCMKLHLMEDEDYVYRILSRVKQFGSIKEAI